MVKLTFLGTGGGRFATIYQARATGGIYIEDEKNLHIDPGPGALVRMRSVGLDPLKTHAILVSHCHPDHYLDAEILIEAMTEGGTRKQGLLIGSRSVIEGDGDFGPAISRYHLQKPKSVKVMAPYSKMSFKPFEISATPSAHSDTSTVGFRIQTTDGMISYVADTQLLEQVIKAHKNCRLLIASVTRPLGQRIPHHLSTEDAGYMIEKIKPEMAVITHFGMRVIQENPETQAKWIEDRSGVRTVAARDFMMLDMGKDGIAVSDRIRSVPDR
ncbi:MAG: MBL fold metallo-hydrolase [Thermoplasmata archaeon]|jgi:ribonuclease BN (tRNA processing enzyme)|nr:MBL fold metallo-hydrolase [Thermoplasmata archaeon]